MSMVPAGRPASPSRVRVRRTRRAVARANPSADPRAARPGPPPAGRRAYRRGADSLPEWPRRRTRCGRPAVVSSTCAPNRPRNNSSGATRQRRSPSAAPRQASPMAAPDQIEPGEGHGGHAVALQPAREKTRRKRGDRKDEQRDDAQRDERPGALRMPDGASRADRSRRCGSAMRESQAGVDQARGRCSVDVGGLDAYAVLLLQAHEPGDQHVERRALEAQPAVRCRHSGSGRAPTRRGRPRARCGRRGPPAIRRTRRCRPRHSRP